MPIHKALLLALIAAISTSNVALAADVPERFMILGPGGQSCGAWLEARRENSWPAAANKAWVLGYLTAYNVYGAGPKNITDGTDVDGVATWIDNYCQANPLDNISTASRALVQALNNPKSQR